MKPLTPAEAQILRDLQCDLDVREARRVPPDGGDVVTPLARFAALSAFCLVALVLIVLYVARSA